MVVVRKLIAIDLDAGGGFIPAGFVYSVHSANSVGKRNIEGPLDAARLQAIGEADRCGRRMASCASATAAVFTLFFRYRSAGGAVIRADGEGHSMSFGACCPVFGSLREGHSGSGGLKSTTACGATVAYGDGCNDIVLTLPIWV
ncbi:hypothetical protein [Paraburkholderia sp. DGU8]|uniref:hypothetical protein n=1 Tax=Paraburkholderia sp. DGU8 TaxID=3161997 RepID=UPI0034671D27